MRHFPTQTLMFLVGYLASGYTSKKPPFLTRQDMCGIWKLSQPTCTNLPLDATEEIVLRLNDDGTFDPLEEATLEEATPREDLHRTLCRGGCWDYREETLLLAADRPKSTGVHNDTLLMGKLLTHVRECLSDPLQESEADIDVHLSVPKGQISTGKFMYPKKHAAFLDDPILFQRATVGTFSMNQLLGNLNARLQSERQAAAKFHKKDFYNRTFYLTATSYPANPVYAAQDLYYDETKATLDLRVLPITFYPNNTFAAIGTEKILRGRYGMAGEERERLWFQVSLFGAGRSAPGSVFSEGRLLSKDDQRGYVGPIQAYPNQRKETILFVDGEFYYGEDLTNPRKTRSWGRFTLQEMDQEDEDEEEDLSGGGDDDNMAAWDEDAFQ